MRPGLPITLLSARGAALYAGCGWWRAVIDRARGESLSPAVTDILADRLEHALLLRPDVSAVIIAGGVAANTAIRTRLTEIASAHARLKFIAPPLRLCTDNAVMVAWAAIERLNAGLIPLPPGTALNPDEDSFVVADCFVLTGLGPRPVSHSRATARERIKNNPRRRGREYIK